MLRPCRSPWTGGGKSAPLVPPDNVTGIHAIAGNGSLDVKWIDSARQQIIENGVLVCEWAGCYVVGKIGSYPTDEKDAGAAFRYDSTEYDRHSSEGVPFEGLQNDVEYFIQFFPYSTTGAVNRDEANRISAMPMAWNADYNGQMDQFFATPGASGKVRLKIGMPLDATGVMVRYKTEPWADGDDMTTGELVEDITDDSAYKHPNAWYTVDGLTDGVSYYFKAIPYASLSYNITAGANETRCIAGGLMADITMDDVAGTTVRDSSGNGYNFTATGGVTYDPDGKVGNAGSVGGSTDRYLRNSALQTAFSGTKEYTVVFDAKIGAGVWPSRNTGASLFAAEEPSGSYLNRSINLGCGDYPSASNYNFRRTTASGTPQDFDTGVPVIRGVYSHYAVRYRGQKLELMIDGVSRFLGDAPGTATATAAFVQIGPAFSASYGQFGLDMDGFKVFSRALQDYELDNIYNGGASC